jgi:hypothetical protein
VPRAPAPLEIKRHITIKKDPTYGCKTTSYSGCKTGQTVKNDPTYGCKTTSYSGCKTGQTVSFWTWCSQTVIPHLQLLGLLVGGLLLQAGRKHLWKLLLVELHHLLDGKTNILPQDLILCSRGCSIRTANILLGLESQLGYQQQAQFWTESYRSHPRLRQTVVSTIFNIYKIKT